MRGPLSTRYAANDTPSATGNEAVRFSVGDKTGILNWLSTLKWYPRVAQLQTLWTSEEGRHPRRKRKL